MKNEVLENPEVIAQGVKRVSTLLVLWGTSWSLQEIAALISIIAGSVGIVYSLSLLWKFWYDVLHPKKTFYSGEIDG